MEFALLEQSVQYTFLNSKYGEDGFKERNMPNVKPGAAAADLAQVGQALADLQDDTLGQAVLIQKSSIALDQE